MELEQLRGLYNKETVDTLLACIKHFVFLGVDTPESEKFILEETKKTFYSDSVIRPSVTRNELRQLPKDKLIFLANGKPPIIDSKISLQRN